VTLLHKACVRQEGRSETRPLPNASHKADRGMITRADVMRIGVGRAEPF